MATALPEKVTTYLERSGLAGEVATVLPLTRTNISGLEPRILACPVSRWNMYGDGLVSRNMR